MTCQGDALRLDPLVKKYQMSVEPLIGDWSFRLSARQIRFTSRTCNCSSVRRNALPSHSLDRMYQLHLFLVNARQSP